MILYNSIFLSDAHWPTLKAQTDNLSQIIYIYPSGQPPHALETCSVNICNANSSVKIKSFRSITSIIMLITVIDNVSHFYLSIHRLFKAFKSSQASQWPGVLLLDHHVAALQHDPDHPLHGLRIQDPQDPRKLQWSQVTCWWCMELIP